MGKNRDFPVIFRVESHHAGRFWSKKFCTGIDFKGVKNNLQGFEGKFTPLALGGWGSAAKGVVQTGHMSDTLNRAHT